ncbi:MAG: hypothetical protein H7A46_00800 [Verrucomicrobiales bacterium]|nr:hypothetical protein [Verrucomicrobiales bacterium]
MKKHLILALTLLSVSCFAADKGDLDGRWKATVKTDYNGTEVRLLSVEGETFTYEVQSEAGETRIFAKGALKYDQCGPLKLVKLTRIRGGTSKEELEPVNDDRVVVYFKGYRSVNLAVNFDGWHDDGAPEAVLFRQQQETR